MEVMKKLTKNKEIWFSIILKFVLIQRLCLSNRDYQSVIKSKYKLFLGCRVDQNHSNNSTPRQILNINQGVSPHMWRTDNAHDRKDKIPWFESFQGIPVLWK